jgi:hypothetical protein
MTHRTHGGVVGYGSLLHPDEIDRTLEASPAEVVPIKCDGYRRVFDNEAAWREGEGAERAVLNATPDPDAWLNGVLIRFGSRADWERYRRRERGYDLREVDPAALTPYRESDQSVIDATSAVRIPVGDRTAEGIRPIPSYLAECLEGARHWNERYDLPFVEAFVSTTELADGAALSTYLDGRRE